MDQYRLIVNYMRWATLSESLTLPPIISQEKPSQAELEIASCPNWIITCLLYVAMITVLKDQAQDYKRSSSKENAVLLTVAAGVQRFDGFL